jgi:hypothetical protein
MNGENVCVRRLQQVDPKPEAVAAAVAMQLIPRPVVSRAATAALLLSLMFLLFSLPQSKTHL